MAAGVAFFRQPGFLPEARSPKPEARSPKPEARSLSLNLKQKLEAQAETRSLKFEVCSPETTNGKEILAPEVGAWVLLN